MLPFKNLLISSRLFSLNYLPASRDGAGHEFAFGGAAGGPCWADRGNMLFRIAAAKGYGEKHGLVCKLETIATGPLGAQGVPAKSIDVGFFPADCRKIRKDRHAASEQLGTGVV